MKRFVSILFILVLALGASAAPQTAALAGGGCQTYTRHISGDSDSGIGGYWATDTYTSTYEVCNTGPGTYTVNRTDVGTFVTWGSTSPSGLGLVVADVNGTIQGTWTGILVTGTINPAATSDLGSVDFQCDHSGTCLSYSSSLAQIFNAGYSPTYPKTWEWTYTACGTGSTWTNSAGGNTGDIADQAGTSCGGGPARKHDRDCRWAYNLLWGKRVDKSGALQYQDRHPFCKNQWEPGYYHYWKNHPELMPVHMPKPSHKAKP